MFEVEGTELVLGQWANLLLCCLIVKLTGIVYNVVSYGNLVFTERLFEVQKTELILGKWANLLLCCLIVKLTCTVYKNISYGNLVFTEQLFEVLEQTLKKLNLFRNKHFVPKQWVNTAYRSVQLKKPFWLL